MLNIGGISAEASDVNLPVFAITVGYRGASDPLVSVPRHSKLNIGAKVRLCHVNNRRLHGSPEREGEKVAGEPSAGDSSP